MIKRWQCKRSVLDKEESQRCIERPGSLYTCTTYTHHPFVPAQSGHSSAILQVFQCNCITKSSPEARENHASRWHWPCSAECLPAKDLPMTTPARSRHGLDPKGPLKSGFYFRLSYKACLERALIGQGQQRAGRCALGPGLKRPVGRPRYYYTCYVVVAYFFDGGGAANYNLL